MAAGDEITTLKHELAALAKRGLALADETGDDKEPLEIPVLRRVAAAANPFLSRASPAQAIRRTVEFAIETLSTDGVDRVPRLGRPYDWQSLAKTQFYWSPAESNYD